MNIDQDLENAVRDGQVAMLLTVFAASAVSEPGFDRESFVAKVEGSLKKMEKAEKPFDESLLALARIVLATIQKPVVTP